VENHEVACQFFYMKQRLAAGIAPKMSAPPKKAPRAHRKSGDVDCGEDLTLASLAKLLSQLTARVDILQEENAKLRKEMSALILGAPSVARKKAPPKVRATPVVILNREPASVDFNAWIDSAIVSMAHLTCVGNKGLLDAMRICVGDHVDNTSALSAPVIVEKQRLYVYHASSAALQACRGDSLEAAKDIGWVSCSNDDLTYIISSITRKIQELFMGWQNENEELIRSCAKAFALNISYMSNLFDAGVSRELRQKNVHAYLLEKIR
jgi:hypothetical protein